MNTEMRSLFDVSEVPATRVKKNLHRLVCNGAEGTNECYTPEYALVRELIEPLREAVGGGWVWEPCAGAGHLVNWLENASFKVYASTLGGEILPFNYYDEEEYCGWNGDLFKAPKSLLCNPHIKAYVSNPLTPYLMRSLSSCWQTQGNMERCLRYFYLPVACMGLSDIEFIGSMACRALSL